MTAVIRVKRRVDEEPFDAFVLNCKKRRLEDEHEASSSTQSTNLLENASETSTVMQFLGTVPNEVFATVLLITSCIWSKMKIKHNHI